MSKVIKLERIYDKDEFKCDITRTLDELSGITVKGYKFYSHYLLKFDYPDDNKNVLLIRVPGGTVGNLYYKEDTKEITKISISTDYVVKTYPQDIQKQMNNLYVGCILEF